MIPFKKKINLIFEIPPSSEKKKLITSYLCYISLLQLFHETFFQRTNFRSLLFEVARDGQNSNG